MYNLDSSNLKTFASRFRRLTRLLVNSGMHRTLARNYAGDALLGLYALTPVVISLAISAPAVKRPRIELISSATEQNLFDYSDVQEAGDKLTWSASSNSFQNSASQNSSPPPTRKQRRTQEAQVRKFLKSLNPPSKSQTS